MSDIKIDIPDITVAVIPDHEYITSVTPSEIYQVDVNVGDIYSVNLQQPDIIVANGSASVYDMAQLAGYAFYAGTASFALSSSGGTSVSSSYSNSSSFAITSISSSYALSTSTASFATSANLANTASYALYALTVAASGAIDYPNLSASNDLYVGNNLTVGNSAVIKSITGSVQSTQVKIYTETSSVYLSASVVSGVYNETRLVNPPISTNSFSGTSIEYTAQRTSDIRSGLIIASWLGNNVTYTDVSNTDIGNTEDLSFNFIKISDDIRLRAVSVGSGSGAWTIQFLFKLFPNLL